MIPITRKEKYINEIVGGGNTAPETPQTREELFFADILGEVVAPSPITRIEKYLAKIANKYSGEPPEPVTRIERFLARAAGMNVSIPTPITREEMFWADYALIVEKEISGVPPLTFNAIAGTLKNYRIYGNTENETRSYSGSAPLSFPIEDGSVSNYRIYGNTVNGESVGNLVTDSQSEHYGNYAIPITNNSETANIYLDEPLTKSGDNADYIDYAEQKRYNADGTSEDVTLPALPAQSTSNSLSIVTTVQPSSVAVDVDEIVSCGDRTKNLLQNAATSKTLNDVTFTINEDDSITCNGTASANIDYRLVALNSYSLPAGNYRLTGAPPTASYSSYYLRAWYNSSGSVTGINDFGRGANFTLTDTTVLLCAIIIASQQVLNNVTFYPMIRKADIEDDTYEPYGYKIPVTLAAGSTETTNIYLDEPLRKVGDEVEYVDYAMQKWHRVRKNLLQHTAKSTTINGVTFTVNDDKSVTCNNTTPPPTTIQLQLIINMHMDAGKYILSGCPSGGSSQTYELSIFGIAKYYSGGVRSRGTPTTFSLPESVDTMNIAILIRPDYTCDNLTFYPMIRKADIEDDTYEPYIENTEVDVTLPEIAVTAGTNTLTVGTEVQPSEGYIKYEGAR